MIIPQKLVDKVRHYLGLNLYETQLWLALLSHGVASAGELSEASGVPRSRSYDVLESLARKGLVITKTDTRPAKYMAIPPEQALENLKKYYDEESLNLKQNLESLKESEVVKKLSEKVSKLEDVVDLSDMIGLLREKRSLFAHLTAALRNAKKFVKIMATPEDIREINNFYLDIIKDAASRGVKVQLLLPEGTDAGELAKYAEIKYTDSQPTRAVVIDGKDAIMLFMDPKEVHPSFDAGVWVSSPYVAETLNNLFEEVWNGSK